MRREAACMGGTKAECCTGGAEAGAGACTEARAQGARAWKAADRWRRVRGAASHVEGGAVRRAHVRRALGMRATASMVKGS